jgi:hypothetical protein
MSTLIPKFVPRGIARSVGDHAYGFFLQTEDGAHPDNLVIAESNATQGLPVLDYDAARAPAATKEHRQLVRSFTAALARGGMIAFSGTVNLTSME